MSSTRSSSAVGWPGPCGARKLGIGTARAISECLDVLEQATAAQTQPKLLERIAALVGWG